MHRCRVLRACSVQADAREAFQPMLGPALQKIVHAIMEVGIREVLTRGTSLLTGRKKHRLRVCFLLASAAAQRGRRTIVKVRVLVVIVAFRLCPFSFTDTVVWAHESRLDWTHESRLESRTMAAARLRPARYHFLQLKWYRIRERLLQCSVQYSHGSQYAYGTVVYRNAI